MSGENKSGASTSKQTKKNADSKNRMQALLGNISAHTQNIAAKSSDETKDVNANDGMMFIDPTSSESTTDVMVRINPKNCYVERQVREGILERDVVERRLSLEAHGQIKPVTVMPRDEQGYRIITGEITYRAASIDPPIPLLAIIRRSEKNIVEHKLILKQLAENTDAVPMNVYEIANSLKRAMEAGNIDNHVELAKEMGWHDPAREDYGRGKVSQYLSLFNLCERGQKLYLDEKMKDVRAIKILSSIRTLSDESYLAIVSMIESGETVTRKMLEKERDNLSSKVKQQTSNQKEKSDGQLKDNGQVGKVEEDKGKSKGDKQRKAGNEVKLPRIIFDYQRKQVELVYKDSPSGKVFCKIIGDESEQILELDCDDIVFNRFVIPK